MTETSSVVIPELRMNEEYALFSVLEGQPEIAPQKPFAIPGQLERMDAKPEHLWLDPQFVESYQPAGNYAVENEFIDEPDWAEGRTDSQRKVFFGRLLLGISEDSLPLGVACKPYGDWHEGAVHEYLALKHVNELGFLRAFEPLGIWVNDEKAAFLITHFERNVVTFDNLNWDLDLDNSLRDHLDPFRALVRSARTLSRLHSSGFEHRDAQIKNMGYDRADGSLRAIDLERLRLVQTPEEPNPEYMQDAMYHDLMCLISSIHARGYSFGESEEDRSEVLRMTIIEHYRGPARHPSSGVSHNYSVDAVVALEAMCDCIQGLTDEDLKEFWALATKTEEVSTVVA